MPLAQMPEMPEMPLAQMPLAHDVSPSVSLSLPLSLSLLLCGLIFFSKLCTRRWRPENPLCPSLLSPEGGAA